MTTGPESKPNVVDGPTISPAAPERASRPSRIRAALIPLAVVVGSAIAAFVLLETGPIAERTPRAREPRLVEVTAAQHTNRDTEITAMGNVVATRETVRTSRAAPLCARTHVHAHARRPSVGVLGTAKHRLAGPFVGFAAHASPP